MADAEIQYEDPKTYKNVGTAPKVSMFKTKSTEDEGKQMDENISKVAFKASQP